MNNKPVLSMTDKIALSDDLHLSSNHGIHITNQIGFMECLYVSNKKQTWAERKKYELLWELKTKKSNINKLIVVTLMIVSITIILTTYTLLSFLIGSQLTVLILGYCGAQLILLSYYFWTSKFECNPNYIKIKHKGKTY